MNNNQNETTQFGLFGNDKTVKTNAPKPQTESMFSDKELANFGAKAQRGQKQAMNMDKRLKLGLISEDPRTDEEKEIDRRITAEKETVEMFEDNNRDPKQESPIQPTDSRYFVRSNNRGDQLMLKRASRQSGKIAKSITTNDWLYSEEIRGIDLTILIEVDGRSNPQHFTAYVFHDGKSIYAESMPNGECEQKPFEYTSIEDLLKLIESRKQILNMRPQKILKYADMVCTSDFRHLAQYSRETGRIAQFDDSMESAIFATDNFEIWIHIKLERDGSFTYELTRRIDEVDHPTIDPNFTDEKELFDYLNNLGDGAPPPSDPEPSDPTPPAESSTIARDRAESATSKFYDSHLHGNQYYEANKRTSQKYGLFVRATLDNWIYSQKINGQELIIWTLKNSRTNLHNYKVLIAGKEVEIHPAIDQTESDLLQLVETYTEKLQPESATDETETTTPPPSDSPVEKKTTPLIDDHRVIHVESERIGQLRTSSQQSGKIAQSTVNPQLIIWSNNDKREYTLHLTPSVYNGEIVSYAAEFQQDRVTMCQADSFLEFPTITDIFSFLVERKAYSPTNKTETLAEGLKPLLDGYTPYTPERPNLTGYSYTTATGEIAIIQGYNAEGDTYTVTVLNRQIPADSMVKALELGDLTPPMKITHEDDTPPEPTDQPTRVEIRQEPDPDQPNQPNLYIFTVYRNGQRLPIDNTRTIPDAIFAAIRHYQDTSITIWYEGEIVHQESDWIIPSAHEFIDMIYDHGDIEGIVHNYNHETQEFDILLNGNTGYAQVEALEMVIAFMRGNVYQAPDTMYPVQEDTEADDILMERPDLTSYTFTNEQGEHCEISRYDEILDTYLVYCKMPPLDEGGIWLSDNIPAMELLKKYVPESPTMNRNDFIGMIYADRDALYWTIEDYDSEYDHFEIVADDYEPEYIDAIDIVGAYYKGDVFNPEDDNDPTPPATDEAETTPESESPLQNAEPEQSGTVEPTIGDWIETKAPTGGNSKTYQITATGEKIIGNRLYNGDTLVQTNSIIDPVEIARIIPAPAQNLKPVTKIFDLEGKDISKMLKKYWKQEYPGLKISITTDWRTCRIHYTDGPKEATIKSLADSFVYGSFNGMIDLYEYKQGDDAITVLQGKAYKRGLQYAFVTRDISAEFYQQAAREVCEEYHLDYADLQWEETRYGKLYIENGDKIFVAGGTSDLAWSINAKTRRRIAESDAPNLKTKPAPTTSNATIVDSKSFVPIIEGKVSVYQNPAEPTKFSITGDTKPIKDDIKRLATRAKWNKTARNGFKGESWGLIADEFPEGLRNFIINYNRNEPDPTSKSDIWRNQKNLDIQARIKQSKPGEYTTYLDIDGEIIPYDVPHQYRGSIESCVAELKRAYYSPKSLTIRYEDAVIYPEDKTPPSDDQSDSTSLSQTFTPNPKRAAQFRAMADTLQSKIDDCFAQRLENTYRRQNQADSKRQDGRNLQQLQSKLYALADHWEAGTVPELLQDYTTKKSLEDILIRLRDYNRFYDNEYNISFYPEYSHMRRTPENEARSKEYWMRTAGSRYLEIFEALNALGAEPQRDKTAEKIQRTERDLLGKKIPGYFPTPPAIVEKMINLINPRIGESILEPSAGKGNIADSIRDKFPDNPLTVIEYNMTLQGILTLKGYSVEESDCLEHTGQYDYIVMNPPFENAQDAEHILYLFENCLNEGGRLVSIASNGVLFRQGKKEQALRDLIDQYGYSEDLPGGTFKNGERSTDVNTCLIVLDK